MSDQQPPATGVAGLQTAGDDRVADLETATDPFALFGSWFGEAETSEPNDPNAMSLATVDEAGLPNVRMVLLKGLDRESSGPDRGFVFYTNLESAKGGELAGQPKAALGFHWKSRERQVRVRGLISPVSADEADAYFATRPRGSQIGAWASAQSRPLDSRGQLAAEVAKVTARHAIGVVPRPPHWSGFRLTPLEIEFWQAGAFRLHHRLQFKRADIGDAWVRTKLWP